MKRQTILIPLACLVLATTTAHADYYSDTQKGWWYGERPVEAEQEEQPAEAKKPVAEPEKPAPWVPPALSTYKYDDIWNMHPKEFTQLLSSYADKAVQEPSEANAKDYYELSEIARKKSQAFTNASQYVWQKYPELSVAKDYPVATPGNLARVSSISNEKSQVLKANKQNYALIYFWKPGCAYCDEQKNILKWFENKTGWIIKPVNIQENPQLAAKVGVELTPTLIMIKKDRDEHFPIASGVATAEEVEEKTYRAVRLLNGDLTPEDYSIYDFQRGGGFDVRDRKDWVKPKE